MNYKRFTLDMRHASPLFSTAQIAALELAATEYNSSKQSVLMERAGQALFDLLKERYECITPYHILCGSGNNGGDGFVLARLAISSGLETIVYVDGAPTAHDATAAWQAMLHSGVQIKSPNEFNPVSGVIVDCIFGTGLHSAPRKPWSSCIDKVNLSGLPVVAADIPSGLITDTGAAPGTVIKADVTLTFIANKPGLLTGVGRHVVGDVFVDSLEVSTASCKNNIYQMSKCMFARCLTERPRHAHKGMFGHVLVVGGDSGYGGAAMMAATASLRSGAGLVSVITHPDHAAALVANRPELMINGLASPDANPELVDQLLDSASVIVIGPGLGKRGFGTEFFDVTLNHIRLHNKPAVIDADALNLLAMDPVSLPSVVLTPHPGEAGRLLGCGSTSVNANRFASVVKLQETYAAVSLLKGSGSLVCDGESILVCSDGNPGMASGGMGDVLSGVIGGLLAQGLNTADALAYAVWLHARAGDRSARRSGEVGMLATDLVSDIRHLINFG